MAEMTALTFGTPAQRAAAQTIVAIASLGKPDAAGIVVKIADGPADARGRLNLAGARVDAADAIVAAASLFAHVVAGAGEESGETFLRNLGMQIALAELNEER